MRVAYLPSPPHGVWHLGPLPVRAYALCLVAGILVGVWAAGRRYRAAVVAGLGGGDRPRAPRPRV
jgi:phosphatidylglycerol---prolipoprotein diacylglyceryl transferase